MKIPILSTFTKNRELQKKVTTLEADLYALRPSIEWLTQMTSEDGIKTPIYPQPIETLFDLVRYSDILKTVHRALKTEIFRKGIQIEEKFSRKCTKCEKEFIDTEPDMCDECGAKTRKPSYEERKTLSNFLKNHINENKQYLADVLKSTEDDINTIDDAYILVGKEYTINNNQITGAKVVDIIRANPNNMRIIADSTGRPGRAADGNRVYVCPLHRELLHKESGKEDDLTTCPQCGTILYPAHFAAFNRETKKEKTYYLEGEIIHWNRYTPSLTYGFPPIITCWLKTITLINEDRYIDKNYGLQRPPKGLLAVNTSNMASLKASWSEMLRQTLKNPHSIQPLAVEATGNKGEFIKYIDFMKSLPEMQFIEQRNEYRRVIGAVFGVMPLFQADTSTSGGLNNESLQVTVTTRATDSAQGDYNDKVLIDIVKEFGVNDWKLILPPTEERDEMAELQRETQNITNATMMRNLGFEIESRNEKGKFIYSDKPVNPPIGEDTGFETSGGALPAGVQPSTQAAQSYSGEPEKVSLGKKINKSDGNTFQTGESVIYGPMSGGEWKYLPATIIEDGAGDMMGQVKIKLEGKNMWTDKDNVNRQAGKTMNLNKRQISKITADEETAQIKINQTRPEAQAPHKFKPAQWTHPNGHPRCIICGDEERTGGMCEGIGDKTPIESLDPQQLKAGIKVEMEHTDNPDIAREIATDHLTEDPEYYKKLKIMESKKKRFTTKFATKTDLKAIYKSVKNEINPKLKLIKKDYEEDLKILEDQLYDKAFDNLTVEESNKVKQILIDSIDEELSISELEKRINTALNGKITLGAIENIIRTEYSAITNKARELNYLKTDPKGEKLYFWLSSPDFRRTPTCANITERTRNGVTMKRLKEIIREEAHATDPTFEVRDWTPHYGCRSTWVRKV